MQATATHHSTSNYMNNGYRIKLDGNEVMRRARQQVWRRALLRWETGAIAGVSLLLALLSAIGILPFQSFWWAFLLLGVAGLGLVVYFTYKDTDFIQGITIELFYEQFNTQRLRTIELRKMVLEAQMYHRLVFRDVSKSHAPLGMIMVDMDEWVTSIYNVALRLDEFIKEPRILNELRRLMEQLSNQPMQVDTLADYNTSLATLEDTEPMMDSFQLEMFHEIKRGVRFANEQLGESMDEVKGLHTRVNTLHVSYANVEAVRTLRNTLTDQLERLDKAYRAVDRLFSLMEVAGTYADSKPS